MNAQNGMKRPLVISVLAGLFFLGSPVLAQQQTPPQPVPAPSSTRTTNAKGGKDKDTQGETVGKSKLEKETGTVNDRIFEVMPNYGTVENAKELPPLSTGQKFRLATAGVFDWGSYPFNGILSANRASKE